jgi:hypothetical protein
MKKAILAHSPLVCPLLSPIHHARPYQTLPSNTVPYAPRRNPPYIPVLPHGGALQPAQRASNTGTIIRYVIGQYYKHAGLYQS